MSGSNKPELANSVHAIVMSDTSGKIVHWNDGAQTLFGYAPEDALGNPLDLIIPEEYRERHWMGFRRAVSTGVCGIDRATMNLPVRCKDGTESPFPGRFFFLQGARNEVLGAVMVCSARQGSEVPFGPIVPL